MTLVDDAARKLFVAGYIRGSGNYPTTDRARAACDAVVETANDERLAVDAVDGRHIASFILEAGRAEGRRAKREVAHDHLYRTHATEVGAVWRRVLKRVPRHHARDIVAHAKAAAEGGSDPVERRRIVTPVIAAMIRPHVTSADRTQLDALNASGWQHAAAYGTAEANATPRGGTTPDPTAVAAVSQDLMDQFAADSGDQSAGWTDAQLAAIAAMAALVVGNGLSADANAKAMNSLTDPSAAQNTYMDSMHATMTSTYIVQLGGLYPEALYNIVTTANACDVCLDLEQANPYNAIEVPDPPIHPNCQCNLELAQAGSYDDIADY